MKNVKYILLFFLGLSVLISCKKEEKDPVLDMGLTKKAAITTPQDGAAFVLTKEKADSLLTTFQWTAAEYNLTNVETVKYVLQMDIADSNFKNVKNVATITTTNYAFTEGAMNKLAVEKKAPYDVPTNFAFRVLSYINNETTYSDAYSDVLTLAITPYEDVVVAKSIYLLGSATTIGWDNLLALEMTNLGAAKYAIVEHLTPGTDQFIKFISILGQWAPQWGTDATGTPESGILVYRPTESVPDPAAIPVGETEGNYYIEADTIGLTYQTILTSGQLFLVGAGSTVGWVNDAGIPFVQDPDTLTKFTLVTTLNATGGLKFLEVSGQWAPQWGSYDGTEAGGTLSYRPTESVPDPPEIIVPGTAGEFLITVDLRRMRYSFKAQ
ncbi:MAG: SusE domain-containing protein [Bacteroidetes bacterium]|nr:SusE domain-containing protein [Bacteroidota bacterium]